MTDIVERLRSEVGSFKDMIERRLEAADEIERLRGENEKMLLANHDCEKLVIDDMREWLFHRRYDEQDCEIGEFQYYDVLSQIDAYEKERLND